MCRVTMLASATLAVCLSHVSRAVEPTPEQKQRIEELRKQIQEKRAEVAKLELELTKLLPPLSGTWYVAETEIAGRVYKASDKKHTWVISGTKLVVDNGTDNPKTHSLIVDQTSTPLRFDLVSDDGKILYRGIWKRDGTDLIICFNPERKERPTNFATEGDGSGLTRQRLKVAEK